MVIEGHKDSSPTELTLWLIIAINELQNCESLFISISTEFLQFRAPPECLGFDTLTGSLINVMRKSKISSDRI
jgi:hypothetical protein